MRELSKTERGKVERAFKRYLRRSRRTKRERHAVFYDIKDIVGRRGFGIGSAGLPAYNVLIEGFNQALENDVVLSMKQANVAGGQPRSSTTTGVRRVLRERGPPHRRQPARAPGAHRPVPRLDHVDKVGYVVAELSPYEADLDWAEITEPDDIEPVLERSAGRPPRSTACPTRTATRTSSTSRPRRRSSRRSSDPEAFVDELVDFGIDYAAKTRRDHALFVDAFREGKFDLVSAVSR